MIALVPMQAMNRNFDGVGDLKTLVQSKFGIRNFYAPGDLRRIAAGKPFLNRYVPGVGRGFAFDIRGTLIAGADSPEYTCGPLGVCQSCEFTEPFSRVDFRLFRIRSRSPDIWRNRLLSPQ